MRIGSLGLAATAALIFTACGGGGSSSSPSVPSGTSSNSTQAQSESAVAVTNALGNPVKSLTSYNGALSPQSVARDTQALVLGSCQNGVEFFAPDKNNDPNSTEQQYFYDAACTQLARDLVRTYQSTGATSETVNVTEKDYAQGSASANATRTNAVTITNGTFDQNGYPIAANGFDRIETGSLSIAGAQSVNSDYELVMLPASAGSNQFCADSAGFNVTGSPRSARRLAGKAVS